MTYSFQVVCKDDEEMGTVLSALFGGLIVLGKDNKALKAELEKIKQEKTSLGIDYDSVNYELNQLKNNSRKKEKGKEPVSSEEAAKHILKELGYDVYMRKNKKMKKKEENDNKK